MIIAFPTEYEAGDFVSRLADRQRVLIGSVPCYRGKLSGKPVLVIISGMGAEMSARRVREVLAQEKPLTLILAGFAGALAPELKKGQVFLADKTMLHTADEVIATAEQKRRLAEQTGCQLVDMETAAVAQVAADAGIKFLAIRAVSDEARETVPVHILAHGYDQTNGVTTPLRMTLHLITHPWQIPALLKFLSPLSAARRNLGNFIIAQMSRID